MAGIKDIIARQLEGDRAVRTAKAKALPSPSSDPWFYLSRDDPQGERYRAWVAQQERQDRKRSKHTGEDPEAL